MVLLNIAVSWLCHCKQTCTVQVLCDRLGIFVDGQLVCIGNPKELTARYGGYVVSPLSNKIYCLLCMASDSALQCLCCALAALELMSDFALKQINNRLLFS